MTHQSHDPAAVQTRLWDEVEKHRTGMLGLMNSGQHFQPMTAFLERAGNQIWFFTYRDTDLAEAASAGGHAMFVFQRDDIQACVGGRLSVHEDAERRDRYWGPVVAAWYPEGKDDPRLTLLCFECEDAEVWLTEAGPVRFAVEIGKSNVTKARPDLGSHTHLDLH